MKRSIIIGVLLALLVLLALTTVALAQGPFGGFSGMMGGGGMMGGPGINPGWGPGAVLTSTVPFNCPVCGGTATFPYSGTVPMGPGMMGGGTMGGGMMGGGMMGGGMMGSGTMGGGMMGGAWAKGTLPGSGTALAIDQAVQKGQEYVASFKNADLELDEIEEYSLNFYGVAREKSTGIEAFQFLIDKYTGAVYPEQGPNMMWNTKYSPMLSHMPGASGLFPGGSMTVSKEAARTKASEYLRTYLPGTSVEDSVDTFYGYYNLDVLKDGKTYGMLSVNGYTGAVWFHNWHGDFIQSKEIK